MEAKSALRAAGFWRIMLIFAITGSFTAFLSGKIMNWFGFEPWSVGYIIGYIVLIFPVYQALLLLTAFIFGRFDYFWGRYVKMFKKIYSLFHR